MNINWQEVFDKLVPDMANFIANIVFAIAVLIIAKVLIDILSHGTKRVIERAKQKPDDQRAKEVITMMTLLRSAARYTIYFAAICIIVNQLGFGSVASNVVTAAGIGALVISLGAQSVIGDVVAGLFIMFERQYAVGDLVRINDYTGTVTSLAMRCTYLKTWKGEKIIIPNGQVRTVVNLSGEFNMALVDVPVSYEDDIEKVTEIIRDVAMTYYHEHPDLCYEEPFVASINGFDASSIKVTIMQKAMKTNHFAVMRDLRMAVKKRFDQEGISIPYDQIVVHQE